MSEDPKCSILPRYLESDFQFVRMLHDGKYSAVGLFDIVQKEMRDPSIKLQTAVKTPRGNGASPDYPSVYHLWTRIDSPALVKPLTYLVDIDTQLMFFPFVPDAAIEGNNVFVVADQRARERYTYFTGMELPNLFENPEIVRDFVLMLAELLVSAEEARVVNLDLKPSNMFVSSQYQPETAEVSVDFNMLDLDSVIAYRPQNGSMIYQGNPRITPSYTAPEVVMGSSEKTALFCPSSDVFSAGVTLAHVVNGENLMDIIPQEGQSLREAYLHAFLLGFGGGVEIHPALSRYQPLVNLIQGTVKKDPRERYTPQGFMEQAIKLDEELSPTRISLSFDF